MFPCITEQLEDIESSDSELSEDSTSMKKLSPQKNSSWDTKRTILMLVLKPSKTSKRELRITKTGKNGSTSIP